MVQYAIVAKNVAIKLTFSLTECFADRNIEGNALIKELPKWGPTWKIQFELTVHSKPPSNLLHGVIDFRSKPCCIVGSRIPLIAIINEKVSVFHAVFDRGNFRLDLKYELNKPKFIEIMQLLDNDGEVCK